MPLTWGKQRGPNPHPHLDTSPFGPSPNLCSDPDYASDKRSGRRDSNPRPSPWQKWGSVLVLEPVSLSCTFRYDWARFSTARYISFFPILPKTADRRAMVRRMFGSIEKKGRRYRARYQSQGRWVTAPVTFTTKAAVKAWLANQAHGHRSRRQGRPQPRQRTPRPLGPQLARNRSDLEETTRANYEGLLRLRACPRSTTARVAEEHRQRRPPVAPGHHEHRLGDD